MVDPSSTIPLIFIDADDKVFMSYSIVMSRINGKQKRTLAFNKYVGIVKEIDGNYRIYKLIQGEPLLQALFVSKDDCIQFTEWIVSTFENYFPIWEQYPDADIVSLCKWTVPHGIRIHQMFTQLTKTIRVNIQSLRELLNTTNENEWTRRS